MKRDPDQANTVSEPYAESIAHEFIVPKGYFKDPMGNAVPFFDNEGRTIVIRCHADGTVTWQLRGVYGEVLQPEHINGGDAHE